MKVADERAVRCPDDDRLLVPRNVKFDLGEETFTYQALYCEECDSYLASYGMESDFPRAADDFLTDVKNRFYPNIIFLDRGE